MQLIKKASSIPEVKDFLEPPAHVDPLGTASILGHDDYVTRTRATIQQMRDIADQAIQDKVNQHDAEMRKALSENPLRKQYWTGLNDNISKYVSENPMTAGLGTAAGTLGLGGLVYALMKNRANKKKKEQVYE